MNEKLKIYIVTRVDGGSFAYSHIAKWHSRYYGLYYDIKNWTPVNVAVTRKLNMKELNEDQIKLLPTGVWNAPEFPRPKHLSEISNSPKQFDYSKPDHIIIRKEKIAEEVTECRQAEFAQIMSDPNSIENTIRQEFVDRARHGFIKYGKGIMRQDVNVLEWAQHMKEELMDGIVYLERLKREIKTKYPELIDHKINIPISK